MSLLQACDSHSIRAVIRAIHPAPNLLVIIYPIADVCETHTHTHTLLYRNFRPISAHWTQYYYECDRSDCMWYVNADTGHMSGRASD